MPHRQNRVSEKRALKNRFGPKRKAVRWDWRKLRNEEIWLLKLRRIKMSGTCGTVGEGEECMKSFGGKSRWEETTLKT